MKNLTLLAVFMGLFYSCAFAQDYSQNCPTAFSNGVINYDILEGCLENEGVYFEVHGIVPMSSMFVVSYRNPQNFFDTAHLSLLGTDDQTREMIKSLKRHDVIRIKGSYEDRVTAPQKHIRAEVIELISSEDQATHSNDYDYNAVPADLLARDHFIGKVHAIYAKGAIMVVEYQDLVVPVFVDETQTHLTKNLFRGDKIEINYVIQRRPSRPIHLNLNPAHPTPLKVLYSVLANHGKKVTHTGKLVLFPKSPMVLFNVFAVDVDMGDDVMLAHTILSFTDVELFKAARLKFEAAWAQNLDSVRKYRNKFVNDAITVSISGTYNMVDPGQANPQIVIDKIEDIVIE